MRWRLGGNTSGFGGGWIDLNGVSGFVAGDIGEGLTGPPAVAVAELAAQALRSGESSETFRRHGPRVAEMSVIVLADTASEFADRRAQLADLVDPTRHGSALILQAERPDGTVRELRCHALGAVTKVAWSGARETVVRVALRASDPYWYAESIDVALSPVGSYSGRRYWDLHILNPGSAVTWPRWQIGGPFGRCRVVNHATGRSWVADAGVHGFLTQLHVECAEGSGSVALMETDGTRSSQLHSLEAANSDLWPLEPGPQRVTVEVFGGDSSTSVRVAFPVRHQTC